MRLFIFFASLLLLCNASYAQSPYTSYEDSTHKGTIILNGLISKYILINNDKDFKWYNNSHNGYSVTSNVLNTMEAAKGKYQFVIFGGTWCEDTQFILPKFFKLQEQSGIADKDISFIGVNREKKSLGNLTAAFNIINVPTIIVMKEGKEVGRVIEYGKTGQWDKELAGLLQ